MRKKPNVLNTAAAIAKGMGVTFKEMMSPTVTEYYHKPFDARFAGCSHDMLKQRFTAETYQRFRKFSSSGSESCAHSGGENQSGFSAGHNEPP